MNRQQKYPDTSTFHWYNANPHNKYTDDCVIRAICTAMNKPWETVFTDLFEIGKHYGLMPTDKKCFERYLQKNGWVKRKQPRKDDNTKYTGDEFCEILQHYDCEYMIEAYTDETVIANIGGHHIVAIIEGRVWDTWNSTDGCIGNYWTKE